MGPLVEYWLMSVTLCITILYLTNENYGLNIQKGLFEFVNIAIYSYFAIYSNIFPSVPIHIEQRIPLNSHNPLYFMGILSILSLHF